MRASTLHLLAPPHEAWAAKATKLQMLKSLRKKVWEFCKLNVQFLTVDFLKNGLPRNAPPPVTINAKRLPFLQPKTEIRENGSRFSMIVVEFGN